MPTLTKGQQITAALVVGLFFLLIFIWGQQSTEEYSNSNSNNNNNYEANNNNHNNNKGPPTKNGPAPTPTPPSITPGNNNNPSGPERIDHDRTILLRGCKGNDYPAIMVNSLSLQTILETIASRTPLNKKGVNIGAATMSTFKYDPTYDAFGPMKYEGILIDAQPTYLSSILEELNPGRGRALVSQVAYVSPSNIESLMFKHPEVSIPRDLDLFKVDIDSFDCDIMETVLSISQPKVVIGEIIPLFPPPFVFVQHYQEKPEVFRDLPYYGCSLSAVAQIARRFKYSLLQLDFWDIILVQDRYADLFPNETSKNETTLFMEGYYQTAFLKHYQERECGYAGNFYAPVVDKWVSMQPDDALQDMYRTLLERETLKKHLKWTLTIDSQQ